MYRWPGRRALLSLSQEPATLAKLGGSRLARRLDVVLGVEVWRVRDDLASLDLDAVERCQLDIGAVSELELEDLVERGAPLEIVHRGDHALEDFVLASGHVDGHAALHHGPLDGSELAEKLENVAKIYAPRFAFGNNFRPSSLN